MASMVPDAPSWSERYTSENTPWDHGRAHPELLRLIEAGRLDPPRPDARALVPGCGRGHDALALVEAGWKVTAIDFAPEVEAPCAPAVTASGGRFLCEDALAHADRGYDLLFEHTFFCAIDPSDRARYGELARRALDPGGRLVALVFPVGKPAETGGPPWGYGVQDLAEALGDGFVLEEQGPVERGIPGRSTPEENWRELLAVFGRLA
jgi:methyl halide transferase